MEIPGITIPEGPFLLGKPTWTSKIVLKSRREVVGIAKGNVSGY
jgi:hypothetical protein